MKAILIPAYQPDGTLLSLIDELVSLKNVVDFQLLVINDGSTEGASRKVIEALEGMPEIKVLHHECNQGKGAALKTGIAWASANHCEILVTADADGQHSATDIIRVMRETSIHNELVLGVRTFDKDTPFRSRFGNNLTSAIFSMAFGKGLQDTQTGLRGIPCKLFEQLLVIKENGYEYEFKCLINITKNEKLIQLPIETIYEPGNPSSHFRPILDSLSIYFIVLRHVSAVLLFALLDFCLFVSLTYSGLNIFEALCTSRLIAITLYFFVARSFVFRSHKRWYVAFIKFILLVGANIVVLAWLIDTINSTFNIPAPIIHPVGNIVLFMVNFYIQKHFIFGGDREIEGN